MSPAMYPLLAGPSRRAMRGVGMIEVLVTIVILIIGLLGLAGLQSKASIAEMESYQRANALALAREMEDNIASGRGLLNDDPVSGAAGYLTLAGSGTSPTVYGTGDSYTSCTALSGASRSVCNWSLALKGASETRGGQNVGAMIGARGCIIATSNPSSAVADFFIVVVWQGIGPEAEPASTSPGGRCAANHDFGAGLRRSVTTRVLIPQLTG